MHKEWTVKRQTGSVFWLMAKLMALIALMSIEATAQTTGTNTVSLVADNLTNATNVATPLVIGASIIWIIWRFVKKAGSRLG